MADDLFESLQDLGFFEEFVGAHFSETPAEVERDFGCKVTIDQELIKFAHSEYVQSIKAYKHLLHSENPDHFKRSGALLHSLYKSRIITDVEFSDNAHGSVESVEADHPIGLSYDDAQDMTRLPRFFIEFHNEFLAFDLAYICCASYVEKPTDYDFDFLYNICFYMWNNSELSVDSFAMIFRSLMRRV